MINRHLVHLWRQMKIHLILTRVYLYQICCLCYCCYAKTSSSSVQKRHSKVYGNPITPSFYSIYPWNWGNSVFIETKTILSRQICKIFSYFTCSTNTGTLSIGVGFLSRSQSRVPTSSFSEDFTKSTIVLQKLFCLLHHKIQFQTVLKTFQSILFYCFFFSILQDVFLQSIATKEFYRMKKLYFRLNNCKNVTFNFLILCLFSL